MTEAWIEPSWNRHQRLQPPHPRSRDVASPAKLEHAPLTALRRFCLQLCQTQCPRPFTTISHNSLSLAAFAGRRLLIYYDRRLQITMPALTTPPTSPPPRPYRRFL